MARWKLSTPHYLMLAEPAEWEYTENDRKTGKVKRKKFLIPSYLDPRDPGDWNYKWGANDDADGEIIVCRGDPQDRDIEFVGDPTPDMIPIDDEAKAISASFEERWRYKPETENPGEYSQSLIDTMQAQIAESSSKPAQIEGMSELLAVMAKNAEQNGEIIRSLAPRRP